MRILAAGDIHGDTGLAKRLAEKAEKEKVDLVVLCGDLTSFERSTKGIIGPFVKRNQKVVLIPGNHESFATADFLAELYGATNLHGYSIKAKDVGLFGCGGANIGINQLREDEIYKVLSYGYGGIRDMKRKIMVTHVHPSESIMEKFTSFFPGSKGVRKAIDTFKPDILLCSHVHEAEGIEEKIGRTRVINVGKEGKVIDL
ncbi:metallophosphoesterase [Candidatus Woesearchaeota archaeon]|nr:metallophosphoesterase [Candidatus Woesearchaeota archaeon]